MLASSYSPVVRASRGFASSAARADFMSWFKRNKKTPAVVEKDTKEVIDEIESGKTLPVENSTVAKLDLTDDNFVGVDISQLEEQTRSKMLESVPFNAWLSGDKISSEEQLSQVVVESYQETFGTVPTDEQLIGGFSSLADKFRFTKALQSKSGYMIPDYQLTRLQTPKGFQLWFERNILSGKQARYRESEPNAIDLSGIKFPPNVYVVPDVKPSEKRQKISRIIEEVSALEAERERQAIERAKKE